mmetsp:Transcript_20396/g.24708  ORF Transcript_20396/g.24708 Transcript_20396/m.24708 type:complete len:80 (-) Transcript_20396:389-628(-)
MALLLYSLGLNARRYFYLFLIIFFVTCAFSVSEEVFLGFTATAAVLVLILIIDYLFLNEDAFKFDPDYTNWSRQNLPKY